MKDFLKDLLGGLSGLLIFFGLWGAGTFVFAYLARFAGLSKVDSSFVGFIAPWGLAIAIVTFGPWLASWWTQRSVRNR